MTIIEPLLTPTARRFWCGALALTGACLFAASLFGGCDSTPAPPKKSATSPRPTRVAHIGFMAAGAQVTVTLVTTPSQVGDQTNTVVVSGSRPESNLANNTATATVRVTAPLQQPSCVKITKLRPGQLVVGKKTVVTMHLARDVGPAVTGIKVRIKGAGINIKTAGANSRGIIKQTLKVKKSGILVFTPLAAPSCVSRLGVRGVFTPPVTG